MFSLQPILTTYHIDAPISPLRVALLADLHNICPPNLETLLRTATPDVICIAGDLYEGPPRKKKFAIVQALEALDICGKIAPVLYSQGNHDQTLHPDILAKIKEIGGYLLTDEKIKLGEVWFGGLSSAYYQKPNIPHLDFAREFASLEGYKILLCHHPEYYRQHLKDLDLPLILSGHNHGGQWSLFGRGVYVPKQGLFPPHTKGVVDGRLVVSRGMSNNVPVPRLFCPTELVLLTLGKDS